MESKEKVLSVKNLKISFKSDSGMVHAVRGVSFDLFKGETLCIVGESGSGKSVTNKAVMGILANNAIIEDGQILYEGEDLVRVSEAEFHRIRGHKIGMIFQDPLSSLNPIMKVGKQITEATLINKNILKRTYNNYFINELVQKRNAKANKTYEIDSYTNTLSNIKNLKKKLVNTKLDQEEVKKEVEEFLVSEKRLIETSLEKYVKDKARSKEKLEALNNDNTYQKSVILEKKISQLDAKIVLAQNTLNSLNLTDQKSSLDVFEKYFLEKKKSSKLNYFSLIKHYNKALNESKKDAKNKIKIYKKEVDSKHSSSLKVLKEELERKESELNSYLETVNEEVKKNYEVMTKKPNFFEKFFSKSPQSTEINISKITVQEDKIASTGDFKLDNMMKEVEDVKNKIFEENRDYISKTKITKAEAKRQALQVMKEVGIPLPEKRFKQYPFEFSGGMRQRIVIAIALTANPDILICDEPTTALDVTIQAQILELINKLKRERHLSCIFITHDLGVVANMADRVAVMYAGKIVEYGTAKEVFFDPRHPYTWALLSSIPDIDSKEKLEAIPGTPPDMRFPPKGDAFAFRSRYAMPLDFKYEPPFFKVSETHYAATWLLYPGAEKVEMPKIVKARIENALKEEKEKEVK